MRNRHWFYLIITTIALASVLLYFNINSNPFLEGPDAYYYALQAKYWALTGNVKIPDSSFIHRLVGLLYLAGISVEQALHSWIAISVAIAIFTVALVRFSNTEPFNTIDGIIFALLLMSPSLLFTAIEFPKMMSMMMVIPLWFLPLIVRKNYWPLSIIIALLSSCLHLSAAPLALLFSVTLIIINLARYRRNNFISIATITGGTVLAALCCFYFKDRLVNSFSGSHWSAGITSLFGETGLPLSIIVELIAAISIFTYIAIHEWQNKAELRGNILLPLALVIPAIIPWKHEGTMWFGERYAVMVPFFLLIGATFIRSNASHNSKGPNKTTRLIILVLLSISVGYSFIKPRYSHPNYLDPNYPNIDKVVSEISGKNIPMFIAHKSFAYYYKYRLMKEAFPFEPEDHWDKTLVWRVLYQISSEELNSYLDDRCLWNSGLLITLSAPDYHLIREDCWHDMRSKILESENIDLYDRTWRTDLNPSKKRPVFLYDKHRNDANEGFPALPDHFEK